ncbi:MAG: carboxymuconolactone decarboxylase family protein [Rhodospirillales bacterium]|nr:carboxymuconolactone decarboxylase family protein [Rhodospirillales bacterium]
MTEPTAGATSSGQGAEPTAQPVRRDRHAIGLEMLQAVDGREGQAVVAALAEICPDFARYLVEFPFGDIYARSGLDLRSREIATIAALTTLGHARPQLEVHVAAGLNVGLSREEIIEIVMQMAVYAGFPAAINGLVAAQAVFERHAAAAEEGAR